MRSLTIPQLSFMQLFFSFADVEKTAWFPFSIPTLFDQSSSEITAIDLHFWLLNNRPSEVCRQVLDTETRFIDQNKQVRFHCLPGTISHSDFPPMLPNRCKFAVFGVVLIMSS